MNSTLDAVRPGGRGAERPAAGVHPGGVDLVFALRLLRRHRRLAAGVAVLVLAAAFFAIMRLPDRYTAQAVVVLNTRESRIADLGAPTEMLLSRTQADLGIVRTELEILTSDATLLAVADRLDLAEEPLLAREPSPLPLEAATTAVRRAATLLTGGAVAAPAVPTDGDGDAGGPTADDLVRFLRDAVEVVNEGGSYALRIRAETGEPELSARIANAMAAVYLEGQERLKSQTLDTASSWLSERLVDLRAAALESERALAEYRARHALARGEGPSLLEARIADTNAALVAANTRLSRARADLAEVEDAMQRGEVDSTAAVLGSLVIQELKAQEAELLARRSQLREVYGERHPALRELEAELGGVRSKIDLEVRRIVASMRSAVNAAEGEVAGLRRELAELNRHRTDGSINEVELAELEREAQANRDIYTEFLAQSNATVARRAGIEPDARLVAPARPRAEPTGPNRKLLLAGSGMAAVCFGAFAALGFGYWRGGFGGARQLEDATGLPTLALVPRYSRGQLRALTEAGELPSCADAVSCLGLTVAARTKIPERRLVLVVTSADEGEGKTVLALSLARALALQGWRTLLVDLDEGRPVSPGRSVRVRRAATVPAGPSEPAVIDGGVPPAPTIRALADMASDDGEGSARAERLAEDIEAMRRDYDVVVLDAPALHNRPRALQASMVADATLLAVRFESTSGEAVRAALRRLRAVGVEPLGTVLIRFSGELFTAEALVSVAGVAGGG